MSPSVQEIRPSKLLKGSSRHIQGMKSHVDDLKLRGEKFREKVTDELIDVRLTRSIESSSVVEVDIYDPDLKLLTHKILTERIDVELDDLWFRLTGVRRSPATTTLLFEDREIARQRQITGARKAYRDKMTRAEFCVSLLREANPKPPIYCPELHEVQPIASAAQDRQAKREADVTRGKGLEDGADLTVKGQRASSEQLRNGEVVLRVGASLEAPRDALVAAIMAGIQENSMSNSGDGFFQMTAATQAATGIKVSDLAAAAHHAYTKGFYRAGLIESIKKGLSPGEAAQAMEGSAYPSLYDQWQKEAEEWVDAFDGATGGSLSVTSTIEKRYAFERTAKENSWSAVGRLMEEVSWRRFCSAGIIYLIAETDLLASKVRMRITPETEGVERIDDFEVMVGKKVDEVTVSADVKTWAAPPGTVAKIAGYGPLDGRYIVSSIGPMSLAVASDARRVSINLKRPQKPLPEPAPETVTKTKTIDLGAGGKGSEVLQKMIAEADRIDAKHYPYVFGGGHGSFDGPYDCSGAVSAVLHAGGFLDTQLTTDGLNSWGESGKGSQCTVFVRNGGAGGGHTIMKLGDRYFGTSGENPGDGAGWHTPSSSYLATLPVQRHPKGL